MLRQVVLKQHSLHGHGRPSSGSSGNDPKELELGLKIDVLDPNTIDEIKQQSSKTACWPIPTDTSLRIGEPSAGNTNSNEDPFNSISPQEQPGRRLVAARNFFGIGNPRRTKSTILSDASPSQAEKKPSTATQWVSYEPFRFSVEFWGVQSLKEGTRLYSQTVFYAGSCYNVYTQAVRKKGVQLGIYLHRQSNVDPIPAASAPRAPSVQPTPSTFSLSFPSTSDINSASNLPMAVTGARPHSRLLGASSPRGHTSAPVSRSPPHRSTTPMAVPRSPRIFHTPSFSSSPPHVGNAGHQASLGMLSNGKSIQICHRATLKGLSSFAALPINSYATTESPVP